MVLNWTWFLAMSLGTSGLVYLAYVAGDEDDPDAYLAAAACGAFAVAVWAGWPVIIEPVGIHLLEWLPQPGTDIQRMTVCVIQFACGAAWFAILAAVPIGLRNIQLRRRGLREVRTQARSSCP
jgi:hypothetical protein